MPNSPKTPLRSLRIDEELWNDVTAMAKVRGETVSDVIRTGLSHYVDESRRRDAEVRLYRFIRLDRSHFFHPSGGERDVTGRLRVADDDVRVGDVLSIHGVFIRITHLTPRRNGELSMRGVIDWGIPQPAPEAGTQPRF